MKALFLTCLLPLTIAVPTIHPADHSTRTPELSTSQWGWIQSTFTDHLGSLPSWTWTKAHDIVDTAAPNVGDVQVQADPEKTIWQQLKDDPNSFSKLVKVIEFQGDAIRYLDGKADPITFFAPNNDALTPPKRGHGHGHHGHHGHHGDDDDLSDIFANPSLASISALIESDVSFTASNAPGGDDDDKKSRRRELIRKLVGKVLMYHAVPYELDAVHVGENSTLETVLTAEDGSFGGLARRIKVKKSILPPSIKLNFYAQILATDRKASNGIFHTLSAPLIPPSSIFESTYLFPDVYSTFTSAVQRLGEEEWVEWEYNRHHGHNHDDDDLNAQLADFAHQLLQELHLEQTQKSNDGKFIGTPLATMFVPTNSAFGLLPPRLKFYLFSPFGQRALKKILGYHYIYDALVLTELQYMGKGYPLPEHDHDDDDLNAVAAAVANVHVEETDKNYKKVFDVTSIINETLHIEIEKKKLPFIKGAVDISLKVNGIPVLESDVPARNGAFHPIGLILVPPHEHHGHGHGDHDHGHEYQDEEKVDSWENWEDWLPAWADQA